MDSISNQTWQKRKLVTLKIDKYKLPTLWNRKKRRSNKNEQKLGI